MARPKVRAVVTPTKICQMPLNYRTHHNAICMVPGLFMYMLMALSTCIVQSFLMRVSSTYVLGTITVFMTKQLAREQSHSGKRVVRGDRRALKPAILAGTGD